MRRVVIASVLAVGLVGCATPRFEEQLSYLELLRARDTITDV